MTSAAKWKAHTSTSEFAKKFNDVTSKYATNNKERTSRMEDFLIEEAKRAEVITSKYDRIQKNPNRWYKHMAPWYDEDCKKTK